VAKNWANFVDFSKPANMAWHLQQKRDINFSGSSQEVSRVKPAADEAAV
jgi:hypothetical protein